MPTADVALAIQSCDRQTATSEHSCDVAIVLSTFNGAAFLPEQLKSFLAQNDVRWKLVWRDDGSTDATQAIIENFSKSLPPGQVVRAGNSGVNIGIFDSFMSLLGEALDAPALAFADQDDILALLSNYYGFSRNLRAASLSYGV